VACDEIAIEYGDDIDDSGVWSVVGVEDSRGDTDMVTRLVDCGMRDKRCGS
jgi:hypothetical protein